MHFALTRGIFNPKLLWMVRGWYYLQHIKKCIFCQFWPCNTNYTTLWHGTKCQTYFLFFILVREALNLSSNQTRGFKIDLFGSYSKFSPNLAFSGKKTPPKRHTFTWDIKSKYSALTQMCLCLPKKLDLIIFYWCVLVYI